MRTLVTGGAGFIGSHLADLLVARGHEVVVLDDLSTGRRDNLAHLLDRPEVRFVEGSVLDPTAVDVAMVGCDQVFHLAAAVGVRLVVDRPLAALETNIKGTETVLAHAHRHRTRVLLTSSSEIYGKNGADRLGEEDDRVLGSPLKSRWAYSAAKAIKEILAYTYWREHGLPTVVVRLFNTVGPRQTGRYGMVLPTLVDLALRGEPLTVYGDGRQSRCFCHVADVVDALVRLVEHPDATGRVFNVGGTEEVTIAALAQRVVDRTGSASEIVFVPYDDAYEPGFEDMRRRVPDLTRVRDLVGFAPRHDLDRIIDDVVAEHRRSLVEGRVP